MSREFDDMRARMAQQQAAAEKEAARQTKIAAYRDAGLSQGVAEYAAALVFPGQSEAQTNLDTTPDTRTPEQIKFDSLRSSGLSEGEATYAAYTKIPGKD